jgi:hypothetical protein
MSDQTARWVAFPGEVQLDGNGTVLRNLANGRIFDRPGSDAASGIP